jgi:N-hydroxyarylamine O-acetyltransferase
LDRKKPNQSLEIRWKAWRQRLRGEPDDLLIVFEKLTLPKRPTPKDVNLRVARAAALCDAALFMLWLAGIAPRQVGRRLQQRQVNLIDIRPADIVTFVGSLAANEVFDKDLAGVTRREFDQCWHVESHFRQDLMAYLFRPSVYLERAYQSQDDIRELMQETDDFTQFVVSAASKEVSSASNDPVVSLGSLVAASLPRDEHVQDLMATVNKMSHDSWTALYDEALIRYGQRLNEGLVTEDFTRMAAMLTEGALAHARSSPAEFTSADMLAGIQLMVNAFVDQTEATTADNTRMADSTMLARYRRQLRLNESLRPDERGLRRLQRAHLDEFPYSNLDIMVGDTFFDLPNYLSRLMNSGHGGMCYQLNYALALVLRAVGFDVKYLWGTVGTRAGIPGTPQGNHLGLLVTLNGMEWLVDAGLGDGPREPVPLVQGGITQGPFHYKLVEGPGTWTLKHDTRGSFAEVVFSKNPVDISAFREPANQQASAAEPNWLTSTLTIMQRRQNEVRVLRGRRYEVVGEHPKPLRIVESREEWLELLATQLGTYLGNMTDRQQHELWDRS